MSLGRRVLKMPSERALTPQESEEFRSCAQTGLKLLSLAGRATTPASAALAVQKYVDGWHSHSPGFLASFFNRRPSIVDAALALGTVWGDQMVQKFGWQWTCVNNGTGDYYGVATPDRSLVAYPTYFVKECLDNPEVDCKLMLAFNMVSSGKIPVQPPKGYANLMDGVHRIVPAR
jgi:hypothetical protein